LHYLKEADDLVDLVVGVAVEEEVAEDLEDLAVEVATEEDHEEGWRFAKAIGHASTLNAFYINLLVIL
jgi:hypothetical protein